MDYTIVEGKTIGDVMNASIECDEAMDLFCKFMQQLGHSTGNLSMTWTTSAHLTLVKREVETFLEKYPEAKEWALGEGFLVPIPKIPKPQVIENENSYCIHIGGAVVFEIGKESGKFYRTPAISSADKNTGLCLDMIGRIIEETCQK